MTDGAGRRPVQLALDLPHEAAMGRDDFVESPANAAALALVDRWPDWPAPAALLIGPEGSGKSHLARIWSARSGAPIVRAGDVTAEDGPRLVAAGALALEDAGPGLDEAALFHLLNLTREQNAFLLLTAAAEPSAWRIGLPDLASRLAALPAVRLEAPDEALLVRVLVKLLADRQLAAEPALLDYVLARMERSLAAARRLVLLLDRLTLERRRPLTRALAAEALSRLAEEAGSRET